MQAIILILACLFSAGHARQDSERAQCGKIPVKEFLPTHHLPGCPASKVITVCWNMNKYSFGGRFGGSAKDKLENSANFGPSATVKYKIKTVEMKSEFTVSDLETNKCDIYQMGINEGDAAGRTNGALPASTVKELKAWAKSSPNHVLLGFGSYPSTMGLGYGAAERGASNPMSASNSGTPIVNDEGPFGSAGDFNQGGMWQGVFNSVPSNACVLMKDQKDKPITVFDLALGSVFISDVDMFTELGGITRTTGIVSANDIFLGNLYAFLIGIVCNGPPQSCDFDTISTCPAINVAEAGKFGKARKTDNTEIKNVAKSEKFGKARKTDNAETKNVAKSEKFGKARKTDNTETKNVAKSEKFGKARKTDSAEIVDKCDLSKCANPPKVGKCEGGYLYSEYDIFSTSFRFGYTTAADCAKKCDETQNCFGYEYHADLKRCGINDRGDEYMKPCPGTDCCADPGIIGKRPWHGPALKQSKYQPGDISCYKPSTCCLGAQRLYAVSAGPMQTLSHKLDTPTMFGAAVLIGFVTMFVGASIMRFHRSHSYRQMEAASRPEDGLE